MDARDLEGGFPAPLSDAHHLAVHAAAGVPCGVLSLATCASSSFRPIGGASLHANDPDESDANFGSQ